MTFEIGNIVESTTKVIGTVVDQDGDIVYIETRSGVEMEFKVGDLKPYLTNKQKAEQEKELVALKRISAAEDIVEIYGDIMLVARAYFNQTIKTLNSTPGMEQPGVTWDSLTKEQQLNYLAVYFGMTVEAYFASYNDGTIDKMVHLLLAILSKAANNGGDMAAARVDVVSESIQNSMKDLLK